MNYATDTFDANKHAFSSQCRLQNQTNTSTRFNSFLCLFVRLWLISKCPSSR